MDLNLVELNLTWADVAELLRTEPMAAAKVESIMLRRENAALVAKLEECGANSSTEIVAEGDREKEGE